MKTLKHVPTYSNEIETQINNLKDYRAHYSNIFTKEIYERTIPAIARQDAARAALAQIPTDLEVNIREDVDWVMNYVAPQSAVIKNPDNMWVRLENGNITWFISIAYNLVIQVKQS